MCVHSFVMIDRVFTACMHTPYHYITSQNEKTVDYIVGFDDLGGSDDFSTDVLEGRLAAAGVIQESASAAMRHLSAVQEKKTSSVRASMIRTDSDEDSDFD